MPDSMSYKFNSNCLKFSYLMAFLLLLQPLAAQYNFTAVDELLAKNQKLPGR